MTRPSKTLAVLPFLVLLGCGGSGADGAESTTPTEETRETVAVETGSITAAMAGAHRSEENRARDAHRHPAETLAFFGLEPQMTVVEMGPGGGWYTEILAPVVRDEGQLIVAVANPETSEYTQRLVAVMQAHPEVFDRVQQQIFEPPDHLSLGEPNSADMVVTFRSTHGWINRGQAPAVFQAMFDVLKPGGVLGLVQHRAPEGSTVSPESGYVTEAAVIEAATAAGFVLEERSEINANPNDDHDHPEGVWSLPPTLRGEGDHAEFEAVGESDRMTLRFRKPAAEGAAAE